MAAGTRYSPLLSPTRRQRRGSIALRASLAAALFAGALSGRVRQADRLRSPDVPDLSRSLSRIIYVLLYLVIGAERLLGAPDHDLQVILGCGIAALILVRAMAACAKRL